MVSKCQTGCLLLWAAVALGVNFTESNGQIFTPGFAILDSPQPGTPMGGDTIQVALDITADGKLNQPPYASDSASQIFNITIFLYSYDTQRNFTISNGTATANNASLGSIIDSEPGSTVKHVTWRWPDCLVGDGSPTSSTSDRGEYNISIRQNFRLNGVDHYTIFDVPISVTNSIPAASNRSSCDSLDNPLLTPEEINATAADSVGILFAPGDATVVQQSGSSSDNGLGGSRPDATAGDGLGSGAGGVTWSSGAVWAAFVLTNIAFLF
ncbi:hypothetical protein BX600DRAFT_198055 [Xylariales sp. PMI_506]|nr:hypothetical protein BX600DRAFT_198055 [Xylariales sp. PMI_506]